MAYTTATEGGFEAAASIIHADSSHLEYVSVPDADLLFRGDYHRAGPDLVTVFLNRNFDDLFFVRGVDRVDKGGGRRLKATDFPSTLFLLTRTTHSPNIELLEPLRPVLK
jgi:hypothetical protein